MGVNTATTPDTGARRSLNLVLATWVSAINFWAWNMIGPLSTTYASDLSLSSTEASMLVATPILVGSLGRIVIGSLTDRFGGRTMFIAVSVASIVPVLAVGAAGTAGSYPLLLVCGFFLGIAGTIFAVGIPFANSWFEASRRGFATGVFGMGWWALRCLRSSHRGSCAGSVSLLLTSSSRSRSRSLRWRAFW